MEQGRSDVGTQIPDDAMPHSGTPCFRFAATLEMPIVSALRFSTVFRRGVTLVEMMISVMILVIVTIAWLRIIGIQSARKEARRREAVEVLSGMMDAFMFKYREGELYEGNYKVSTNGNTVAFERERTTNNVYNLFDVDISPIGYQLCVVPKEYLPNTDKFKGWEPMLPLDDREYHYWLVGRLFQRYGKAGDAGAPFFVLPVCLGR